VTDIKRALLFNIISLLLHAFSPEAASFLMPLEKKVFG
jgi:hypothetical protein